MMNLNALKSQAVGVAPLPYRNALRVRVFTGVYVLVRSKNGNINIGSLKNVYF